MSRAEKSSQTMKSAGWRGAWRWGYLFNLTEHGTVMFSSLGEYTTLLLADVNQKSYLEQKAHMSEVQAFL